MFPSPHFRLASLMQRTRMAGPHCTLESSTTTDFSDQLVKVNTPKGHFKVFVLLVIIIVVFTDMPLTCKEF